MRHDTTADVPGVLSVFGAVPSPVTVTAARQGLGRRIGHALTALAISWPLAAVCVFIPLGHFVLVPGLLITGGVVAMMKLREDWSIVRVRGVCPRCQREQEFTPGGRLASGRTFECPRCLNTLRLVVADGAQQ
jgi:hypothetical protein